jgi:GNAT superfamily N-acetyltransferase
MCDFYRSNGGGSMPRMSTTKKKKMKAIRHASSPPVSRHASSSQTSFRSAVGALPLPALSIQPARPADQPFIEMLADQLFPHTRPTFGVNDHYFVAHIKKNLAGWAHLRLSSRSVILQGLAVHPLHQRRGIGRALLLSALSWASKMHPSQPIELKVKSANAPALSLYLKEGFTLTQDAGGVYRLRRAPPN